MINPHRARRLWEASEAPLSGRPYQWAGRAQLLACWALGERPSAAALRLARDQSRKAPQ